MANYWGRRHSLTPLELKIMQVLWRCGPSCVRDVQTALRSTSPLAYTSVQTVLNILNRKNHAKRLQRGRAYYYEAKLSYQQALDSAVCDIVERICEGSLEELLASVGRIRQLHRSSSKDEFNTIRSRSH